MRIKIEWIEFIRLFATLSLSALSSNVLADKYQSDNSSEGTAERNWSLAIGGGITYFVPFFDASYTYKNWKLSLGGLSYNFIDTKIFQLGTRLGFDGGRDDDDLPPDRRGLGDVDGGLEAKLFVEYQAFGGISLSFDATQSFADSNGLTLTAAIKTEFPLFKEQVFGGVGVIASWANSDHMLISLIKTGI